MSSMHRSSIAASALLLLFAGLSTPAYCADGAEWDRARSELAASPPGPIAPAIDHWRALTASENYPFEQYAWFLLTYPGMPEEAKLRASAEKALMREGIAPARVVALFDRHPPLTNQARAIYAASLLALGRPEAEKVSREAWRNGPMDSRSEEAIYARYGSTFTAADHDARVDALLWAGDAFNASRWMNFVSPGARDAAMARLTLLQGQHPGAVATPALNDPGVVYNLSRHLRRTGQVGEANRLLAERPKAAGVPRDQTRFIAEMLAAARSASAPTAVRIAESVDDVFAPNEDISRQTFKIRDDYTTLMWLGGTRALSELRDERRAAALFHRYGMAARTPQTRSKGLYWAGRALAIGRDNNAARPYFESAAQYGDHFYGQLALEWLGRPVPKFDRGPTVQPTAEQRAAFWAKPLTQAVREVARNSDWLTGVKFFREISDQAETEVDHVLVAELAKSLGRRDLGVILGQAAHTDGFGNFQQISFPLMPANGARDWAMAHAITRQESQFAMNAISHAGARGLMQLMPGTAREQAGKMGLNYNLGALLTDAHYNIQLGDGYFARMLSYFGGSYPLAVAAYNAGPGNVNKWLRLNGDPRRGEIDWIEWLERIPIYETKNYVQRVLENAVVYEAMNPDRARSRGPAPLSRFIGKSTPG
jgi:soluble lytic murein transglycosylase